MNISQRMLLKSARLSFSRFTWQTGKQALSCALIACSLLSANAAAGDGGISLNTTRVIYPAGAKSQSLSISNSSTTSRYLIQSWVDDAAGNRTSDYVVTPPLYNSAPGDTNDLKIIATRKSGPADREQLYYLNVKSIPAVDKKSLEGKNTLMVTTSTRIKLIVRPKGLPMTLQEAAKRLTFGVQDGHLVAVNPTPYHLTLTGVRAGDRPVGGVMVSPFGRAVLAAGPAGSVSYQVINDYGGTLDVMKATAGR